MTHKYIIWKLTAESVRGSGTVHGLCHVLLTVTCSAVDDCMRSCRHSDHYHNDSVPPVPYVMDCTAYTDDITKLSN